MQPDLGNIQMHLKMVTEKLRSEIAMSSVLAIDAQEPILSALDLLIDQFAVDRKGSKPDAEENRQQILSAIEAVAIASVEAHMAAVGGVRQKTWSQRLDHLLDEAFAFVARLNTREN